MILILSEDIISHCKRNLYGSRGERVVLIAVHGNVAIVEGVSGRFPVHISKTFESGSKDLQSEQPERRDSNSGDLPPGIRKTKDPIIPAKSYSEPLPQKPHTAPTLF